MPAGSRKRSAAIIDTDTDSDDSDFERSLSAKKEVSKNGSTGPTKKKSKPHFSSDSETSDSGEEWSDKKSTSKKKDSVKVTPRRRLSHSDENDIEDGEVSESDSLSGLDEEENKKLSGMTEAEREMAIFKRLEEKERQDRRQMIEKKLKAAQRQQHKGGSDDDEGWSSIRERRADRQEAINKKRTEPKASALERLKANRQEKQRKEEEKKKASLKVDDVWSSNESSSESEDEQSSEKSVSPARSASPFLSRSASESSSEDEKPEAISSLEQLSRMRLSRYKLSKLCHSSFFRETVMGCYVRVGIGQHEGRQVYRVAEIIDIVETGKIYQLEGTRTNRGLRLRHGSSERVYRMEFISNQDFSQSEYHHWVEAVALAGMTLPTTAEVDQKEKEVKAAMLKKLDDSEISRIIEEKNRFRRTPLNYAMQKTRLLKEKEVAEMKGNRDELGEVNKKLEDLEERATELDRRRTANISGVSYINQRNRLKNITDAEEAFKREFKDLRTRSADPFTRRSCRPTLVTKVRDDGQAQLQKKAVEEQQQQLKQLAVKEDSKHAKQIPDASASSAPAGKANLVKDPASEDMFEIHDFELDIQLPSVDHDAVAVPAAAPAPVAAPSGPKRSLNLDDYKRRKGLI